MPCKARTRFHPSSFAPASLLSSFMSYPMLRRTAPKLSPGPSSTQSFSYWSRVRIKDLLGPQAQWSSQDCSALRALSRLQPGIFSTACMSDLDSGSLRERCLIVFPCDFKLHEHKRRAGPDRSCVCVSVCGAVHGYYGLLSEV